MRKQDNGGLALKALECSDGCLRFFHVTKRRPYPPAFQSDWIRKAFWHRTGVIPDFAFGYESHCVLKSKVDQAVVYCGRDCGTGLIATSCSKVRERRVEIASKGPVHFTKKFHKL